MANIEQTLAYILRQLEQARAIGDDQAIAELLLRKDAICAMMNAHESTWH